jgi:hypothetical protein
MVVREIRLMDPVFDGCERKSHLMDPVLDGCVRGPIMDPVLDGCEREPSIHVQSSFQRETKSEEKK